MGRRGARLFPALAALLLAAALAGCSASMAFRDGQDLMAQGKSDEGLLKLQEAVDRDPRNAEYRIALVNARLSLINGLLMSADQARRDGRLTDAEKDYLRVLHFDANHVMARQGLESLITERRHRVMVGEAEELFKKGTTADLNDALEKLRVVLLENPKQKEALSLKQRVNEVLAKNQRQESRLAAVYRKPITLEFRDAPLKSVFDVVSKVSGLNFFFDKDVRPDLKTTILAKNTSIEDAVRLLLVTNQLEQKVLNDNSILIYPNTPQKLKDYQPRSVRTFYLTNADVKAVSNSIKTIVKTTDMVVDERLGLIIIRDSPQAIRMAERIVALQDLAEPEVMLDVEVMEVKRTRLLELGVQWPSQLTLSPLPGKGSSVTLEDLNQLRPSTIQASLGSGVFNANKQDTDGNILANPRIRVRNKEKAKVLIGDRVPVITTTSTSTGFVSESVNYVDVGLKLEVEPNIYLDSDVAIKINLEVSSIVREVKSASGTLSYQIGTRGANTLLQLKDGETQVLAGLISDEERATANKVPGLGEMPILGRLFGSQKDDSSRTEILLSITPHVVRSIRRPDLLAAEFDAGTESNIGGDALRLSVVEPVADSGKEAAAAAGGATPMTAPEAARQVAPVPSSPAPVAVATPLPAASSAASPRAVPVPVPVRAAAAAPNGGPKLSWAAPAQVRVGEQFSAVLRLESQQPLRALPLMVGVDPQVLQLTGVQEGEFFRQANGQTNFSHRDDPAQGKAFVAVVRQGENGGQATGVNGGGSVVIVNFKALKTGQATIRLLSATPEPLPESPLLLPVTQVVKVVQ